MTSDRARFRLQVVLVVALIGLVSWPQWHPVTATTIWRAHGPLEPVQRTTEDHRLQYGKDERARVGYGSTANASDIDAERQVNRKRFDPVENATASNTTSKADMAAIGARLNGITGRARTNLNAPVPYARLVLRNILTGRIEARATADQEGQFRFIDVGASGYIIELLGQDGSVVASSETVAVENGELKQATVRVAAASTVKALFNNVLAPTTTEPVQTAAQSGVDKITASTNCVSSGPPC